MRLHFISGLPRAGSTLLANILAQNPAFHVTPTSGIIDVLFHVRQVWDTIIGFKAAPDEAARLRVLHGILSSYFKPHRDKIIFDKSRSWLAHLEMIEAVMGGGVKVLVPVRDVRDVLASFEKLYRANPTRQMAQERTNYVDFQTVQGRCAVWMRPDQPVGLAVNRVQDVLARGLRDRLFFVPFEDLTRYPDTVMREAYQFLGLPPFQHDFDCVEQVTWENDEVHGMPGLHDIRREVRPVPSQWPAILGQWASNVNPVTGQLERISDARRPDTSRPS